LGWVGLGVNLGWLDWVGFKKMDPRLTLLHTMQMMQLTLGQTTYIFCKAM